MLANETKIIIGNDQISWGPFNKVINYDKEMNQKVLDSIQILSSWVYPICKMGNPGGL